MIHTLLQTRYKHRFSLNTTPILVELSSYVFRSYKRININLRLKIVCKRQKVHSKLYTIIIRFHNLKFYIYIYLFIYIHVCMYVQGGSNMTGTNWLVYTQIVPVIFEPPCMYICMYVLRFVLKYVTTVAITACLCILLNLFIWTAVVRCSTQWLTCKRYAKYCSGKLLHSMHWFHLLYSLKLFRYLVQCVVLISE
jgi:hypothetical protein